MKKLISLLLAVSVMAMSTVAFADVQSLQAVNSNRNPGANNLAAGKYNSDYFRILQKNAQSGNWAVSNTIAAVYRPGDTLTFRLTQADGGTIGLSAGETVTFISYKLDEDLTNETVQFVDQVPATGAGFTATYKLREDLEEGFYRLDAKFGDADTLSFYYAIADPKVDLATTDADGEIPAEVRNGKAYYFAAIHKGTNDAMFYSTGVQEVGFSFNGVEYTMPTTAFDTADLQNEDAGDVYWFYTIAVDLEGGATAPNVEVEAVMNGEVNAN